MMHLNFLRLLLFALLSVLVACSKYDAVSKLAGHPLETGVYAFRYGTALKLTGLGHYRLLVVWIGRQQRGKTMSDVEVKTAVLDQVQEESTKPLAHYFGATCDSEYEKIDWDFERNAGGGKYTFLGKVKSTMTVDKIQKQGKIVTEDNNVYNLIYNNCGTYVQELFEKIKARDLVRRMLSVLDEDRIVTRSIIDDEDDNAILQTREESEVGSLLPRNLDALAARLVELSDIEPLYTRSHLDNEVGLWIREILSY